MKEENRERQLAKEFTLHTNRSIFLTGKAGTGKTTLLKEILEETDKNYLIAAPTGVAAINAGGITLHSLFLFPLQAFIPGQNPALNPDTFCTYAALAGHQKFNRSKLDIFLELELLVIDEISMVRVDLMDAIDVTLRRVRKNQQPFGGVQLLVIGDLYQLSPVVRPDVQQGLMQYYSSPYFFDAKSWQKVAALTIELKKVYRQEDQDFIDILNSVRNGDKDKAVLAKLNTRYGDEDYDADNVITLTTHNRQADAINEEALANLPSDYINLEATISGKFSESAYPTPEIINLKKGAQVMFIRNHPEGLYYNGKLGTITHISDTVIKVKGLDDNTTILVDQVEWKNVRYELDEETDKIIPNDVGSFQQYPLRLAWAVTVHKSQGLTFDKLVVDLAKTFAAGQLYVALSRCRSLEGLKLLSEIKAENVITEQRIVSYYTAAADLANVDKELQEAKESYERYLLLKTFSLEKLSVNVDQWQEVLKEKDVVGKGNIQQLINEINSEIARLDGVAKSFKNKMENYFTNGNIEKTFVKERVSKAIGYFVEQLDKEILKPLIKHIAEYTVKKNTKTYLREVESLELVVSKLIAKLYKVTYLGKLAYTDVQTYMPADTKKGKTEKKKKGATIDITYQMHKDGKSINLIAKERGLAPGTIESHLAKLITAQKVSIYDIIKDKKVEKALAVAQSYPDLSLTDLIKKMPFKMTFGELRMITNYRDLLGE